MADEPISFPPRLMGVIGRTILGVCIVLVSGLLVYLLVEFWPTAEPGASGKVTVAMFGTTMTLAAEVRLILLVAVTAALGSNIHTARFFAYYAGERRLYTSFVWWYIPQLFIGASIALIFYFAIRGGLLSAGATIGELNIFGIAAIAGLVGLFSYQATEKLRELFDTLFKTEKPH